MSLRDEQNILRIMDPAKLKVVELRAALAERSLDTKGNKPVLVERLRKALEEETDDYGQEKMVVHAENISDTTFKETSEEVAETPRFSQQLRTPGRSSRSSSMVTPTKVSTRNASRTATTPNSSKQFSPYKPQYMEKTNEALGTISEFTSEESVVQPGGISKLSPEKYSLQESDSAHMIQHKSHIVPTETSQEEIKCINVLKDNRCEINISQVPVKEPSEKSSTSQHVDQFSITHEEYGARKSNIDEPSKVEHPVIETMFDKTKNITKLGKSDEPKQTIDIETVQHHNLEGHIERKNSFEEENIEHMEDTYNIKDNADIPVIEQPAHVIRDQDQANKTYDLELKDKEKAIDNDYTIKEDKIDISVNMEDTNEKTHISDIPQNEQAVEMIGTKYEDAKLDAEESKKKDSKDKKRKRSSSPAEIRQKSPVPHQVEDEPDIDKSAVTLSWYDSDLNLIINKDQFLSAKPMYEDGFCYVSAGTRASYGFINGKVYYEAKITEHCPTTIQDEKHSHMLRVGWSVPYTSMQLGEEKLSYAYASTGKKGTGNEFTDYGSQYGKGDVVGCYLDMTPENTVELSYTVNGKDLGSAFSISKEELRDKPLFPHILSKNCKFVCNFGQEEAWCEQLPEYTFVGHIELKDRVAGPRRPDRKQDCEVIMMCGLPASGKTVWARKYATEHPDKLYNILGLRDLVEKTEDVTSLSGQKHRREDVIDKCTRILNKLIELASVRRRNYILDQKNVYSSVQRRKMRGFHGYHRKAVVVVPTDEEFNQRLATHETFEGKSTSDSKIMEMKANFTAPSIGEFFDTVEWVGLGKEEAKKLIEKYNKESKEAGFGPQQAAKRPRFDKTDSNKESRDSRSSRDNRDHRDHRDRRSNYQDRNRNSSWRGGNNMGGGWRDNRSSRGGFRHGGGYGPPIPWRRRGVPPIRGADRRGGGTIDRRSGNDRNRPVTSRQGGWAPMSSNYQGSQQSGWGQQDNWSSGQSQGNWGQQGGWSQQQWGYGKGYGQGTYGQTGYNQGYGNGNWNNWNQQYYNNQYWSQQQQSGQTTTASGQAEIASETVATTSTDTAGTGYNYSQGWQNFTQGQTMPSRSPATAITQQSHSYK